MPITVVGMGVELLLKLQYARNHEISIRGIAVT